MKDSPTYYETLEINESASASEIKTAYRKLAQAYHPDKVPSDWPRLKKDAEDKFKQINEAYQILSSAWKRRRYDTTLAEHRERRGQRESEGSGPQPHRQASSDDIPRSVRVGNAISIAVGIVLLFFLMGGVILLTRYVGMKIDALLSNQAMPPVFKGGHERVPC